MQNSFSRKKASTRVTKALLIVIWLLIIALLCGGGWYVYDQVQQLSADKQVTRPQSVFTPSLLIAVEDSGFSSVEPEFLLLRFDGVNNEIAVAVLPGEMNATVNGKTATLLEQYKYGGVLQIKSAVKSALGITPDRFAALSEATLEQFINSMGGVGYNVSERMYFEASDGTILADLKSGKQTLTGEQIAEYFRYGKWSDSYKSANERAKLAAAIINQYASVQGVQKLTSAFSGISNTLNTDLSVMDVDLISQNIDKFTVLESPASAITVSGSKGELSGEAADKIKQSFK